MLESTYETLAAKKRAIREKADTIAARGDSDDVRSLWRPMEFKEEKRAIGAEDGSENQRSYKGFALYAANAVSLVFNGATKEFVGSDVDLMAPYRVEERISIYRGILEFRVALEALRFSDVFLVDGSLRSSLSSPRGMNEGLDSEEREEVESLLPALEESEKMEIASRGLGSGFGENRDVKQAYLEYLEYLCCLARLLREGMDKIVAISKTSSRSTLSDGLPDVAAFEGATPEPGYSELAYEGTAQMRRSFPMYDDFLNGLEFTVSCVRLERGRGVMMMEVPRKLADEQVVEILEGIRAVSVDGYPYPLRKAHRRCAISNRDMDVILNSLGILAKTGREAL